MLNSEIKKKANAPFKKCLENLLAVDKLKWITQVKETEIKEINLVELHRSIDTHHKVEDMDRTQWMVCHLKVMDFQEDMELHHKWVAHHLNTAEANTVMAKDHLQEWWEVLLKIQEKNNTEAECHPTVECTAKEAHKVVHQEVHQVIMIWAEAAMEEWEITILIFHSTNNMVVLTIWDNMEVLHQWEWEEEVACLTEDHKMAFTEAHQWIQEAEVTINHHQLVSHLKITHQATANQIQEDTVKTKDIHLQMVDKEPHQFQTVPTVTFNHQLTSIQILWVTNLQPVLTNFFNWQVKVQIFQTQLMQEDSVSSLFSISRTPSTLRWQLRICWTNSINPTPPSISNWPLLKMMIMTHLVLGLIASQRQVSTKTPTTSSHQKSQFMKMPK